MRARKRFRGSTFCMIGLVLRNIASAMSLRQNQRVFELVGQGALTDICLMMA